MEPREEEKCSLSLVRHELDMLNDARLVSGFGLEDAERYQQLCQIEKRLLGTVAA